MSVNPIYDDGALPKPAPTLADFILRSIDRPQAPRLRISQAGSKCERKIAYQATGAARKPVSEAGAVKMAIGSALDAYALAGASLDVQAEFRAVPQKPVEITMGGITLLGTADVLFLGADGPELVSDLKTIGLSTWQKIQNAPKQEHQAQVNLYAFGIGAPRWSVCYVYVDPSSEVPAFREHFGETDSFAAKRDFGLFETVSYYLQRNELPPRAFEDFEEDDGTVKRARDQFDCRYCDFRETCWGADETPDDES